MRHGFPLFPERTGDLKGRPSSPESGFTLLEVLIAVVILATGLLLIAEGLSRGQQELRTADYLILASQSAETRLAEAQIRLREYHKLNTGQDEGTEKQPGRLIRWQSQVSPYLHATIRDETKLNRLALRLDWKEGAHREGGLLLETLLLNREKQQQ